MAYRLTGQDLLNSRIQFAIGMCDQARQFAYCNAAQRRLLWKGKWFGTYAKFLICATDGCITLPGQIATIEMAAICGRPIPVHDQWFEFMGSGAGIRGCFNSCWNEAQSKGYFPVFSDIVGTDKKLNFICDVSTDVGKTVLLLGYDANGNWIRTIQNGVYQDGEVIALAQTNGTTTQNFFSAITGIQFVSAMDGQSWLYEYSTTALTKRLIGHYQYNELKPSYARYLFPSIQQQTCTGTTCTNTVRVEIMAKLEFMPLVQPTDYLIIQNLEALEEMMQALVKAEDTRDATERMAIIASGEKTAVDILNAQLNHYLGDGRERGIQMQGSSVGDLCPVDNFI